MAGDGVVLHEGIGVQIHGEWLDLNEGFKSRYPSHGGIQREKWLSERLSFRIVVD